MSYRQGIRDYIQETPMPNTSILSPGMAKTKGQMWYLCRRRSDHLFQSTVRLFLRRGVFVLRLI